MYGIIRLFKGARTVVGSYIENIVDHNEVIHHISNIMVTRCVRKHGILQEEHVS